MKKLFLSLSFLTSSICFSQIDSKVFEARKIYFYGYDFSHFKFVDTRERDPKLIKECIPGWVTFVNEKRGSEKHLKNYLDVDTVIMNYDVTTSKYSKINIEERIGVSVSYVNKDSIDYWIKSYPFPDKSGIGLIVFVDCMYKPDKLNSLTWVFFDLETKQVLSKDRAESTNADGHGLVATWGVGMNESIGKYFSKVYAPYKKEYKKKNQ